MKQRNKTPKDGVVFRVLGPRTSPLTSLHTGLIALPWGPEVPFGGLAVLCLLTVYLSADQVPASQPSWARSLGPLLAMCKD